MRMRTWVRSRRLSASVRGEWPTTPANACVCATSTRPSRSSVTCVNYTWRVRSRRPSCWSSTRLWRWSSAWNNKSEVSACLLQGGQSQMMMAHPRWKLGFSQLFTENSFSLFRHLFLHIHFLPLLLLVKIEWIYIYFWPHEGSTVSRKHSIVWQ